MSTAPTDPAVDAENTAWVVITVSTITMTVAFLTLAARVYTRAVIVKQFGADDYGAVAAGVSLLLCGIWVCLNIKNGLGRHAWTLTGPEITQYFKYFYISIVWYNVTLVIVKLSFLAQYYRVFSVPKIRRIILVFMFVIGGWSLSQVFVGIWICAPIAKFWDSTLEGHCIPNIPQWYINAAGNIASDVSIFCLPIPILKRLNLKRRQKILVMGIFSLGFFTCAISIIRIKYLKQYADFSWENVASSCWSVSELSSAVTCLCLPTLKPLVQKMLPRLMSSTYKSGGSDNTGPSAGVHGHSSKGYRKHSEGSSPSSPSSSTERSKRLSKSGNVTMSTVMTTESQDELYIADDIEMSSSSNGSLSMERKGSGDLEAGRGNGGVNVYPTDSAPPTPASAHRDNLLGLRTTVRTKIGVNPYQAQMEDDQIQVTRDVITQSVPRRK
ncbi:hypothetical protein Sste5346_008529 [Sporothrix stenoceras]|uniref:Rhodopsin domain-containing protein n=1 Tax=Sporothrix stenoceras TaxID=5173 RepID=A0ABR3YNR2_9PEZI